MAPISIDRDLPRLSLSMTNERTSKSAAFVVAGACPPVHFDIPSPPHFVIYSSPPVTLQLAASTTARSRWRLLAWSSFAITVAGAPRVWTAAQLAPLPLRPPSRLVVNAVSVPLNPEDPAATTAGDFEYAGGIELTSSQTNLVHELSDIILIGPDRFAAVGDEGTLLEARIVLDESGRLTGVTDADVSRLVGEDGRPVFGADADAEGLALLPMGDRIVSFETRARILRYPKSGGPPRRAPSPRVPFPPAAGMEALTARPDLGVDAYMVGSERLGGNVDVPAAIVVRQGSDPRQAEGIRSRVDDVYLCRHDCVSAARLRSRPWRTDHDDDQARDDGDRPNGPGGTDDGRQLRRHDVGAPARREAPFLPHL